jgi:hypothetical protein
MANDRARAQLPPRPTGDLTLGGLLDVLDRAEPLPSPGGHRPRRAARHRSGGARRLRAGWPPSDRSRYRRCARVRRLRSRCRPPRRPRPSRPPPRRPVRACGPGCAAWSAGWRSGVPDLTAPTWRGAARLPPPRLPPPRFPAPTARSCSPSCRTPPRSSPRRLPPPRRSVRPGPPGRLSTPASRWSPRSPGTCRHRGLPPHREPRRVGLRPEQPGLPLRPGRVATRGPLRPVGSHPAEGPRPPHPSHARGGTRDGAGSGPPCPGTRRGRRPPQRLPAPAAGHRPLRWPGRRAPGVSAPPDRPRTAPGASLRRWEPRRPSSPAPPVPASTPRRLRPDALLRTLQGGGDRCAARLSGDRDRPRRRQVRAGTRPPGL